MQQLAHPDGEVGTSKATAAFQVPMGLSNYATMDLEQVASHGKGNPYIMQMSLLKNKEAMIKLMKRAESKLNPPDRKKQYHPERHLIPMCRGWLQSAIRCS